MYNPESYIPSSDRISFPQVDVNVGNHWNETSHRFQTPQSGVYFISFSAGALYTKPVHSVLIKSGHPLIGLQRSSSNQPEGIVASEFMAKLKHGDTLHVSSSGFIGGAAFYSATSFCLFDLHSVMGTEPVAFSVSREKPLKKPSNPVPFNVNLVNLGFHFNMRNHKFTAPSAGLYYFSFSIGIPPSLSVEFILYKNGQPFVDITQAYMNKNGHDILSRSIMTELRAGDNLYMVNNGSALYSDHLKPTSFLGFKYEPLYDDMEVGLNILCGLF